MVLYGEYLFLENFITGLILLYFTSRLVQHEIPSGKRFAVGGVLSGISAFLIFLPLNGLLAILLRLLLAIFITTITFGRRDCLKKAGIFMILSFLSGSMVMALFLWLQIPALSANGFLYIESFSYITLMILGLPAMGVCWWFISLIRKGKGQRETFGTAELVLGEHSYSFRAFVDTGNGLRDPMTGKMVVLVDEKGRNRMDQQELYRENRAVLIPYHAVGTERGVLNGVRIDGLRFQEKEWPHVVVAFYDGKFDGYEVLLHQEILEGGLLEHG